MKNEISREGSILDAVDLNTPGWHGGMKLLTCPVCGHDYTHVEPPHLNHNAQWGGEGELAVTPVWSECGSKWQVCIGFHKGQSAIFTRMIESCKNRQPPL